MFYTWIFCLTQIFPMFYIEISYVLHRDFLCFTRAFSMFYTEIFHVLHRIFYAFLCFSREFSICVLHRDFACLHRNFLFYTEILYFIQRFSMFYTGIFLWFTKSFICIFTHGLLFLYVLNSQVSFNVF